MDTSPKDINLIKLMDKQNIDVREVMDLHAQVKATHSKEERKSSNIAHTWAESGRYMINMKNYKSAEICYFLANLYEKKNKEYILSLIDCYRYNEKYKYAIEFVQRLYLSLDGEDDQVFWTKLVDILPIDQVLGQLTGPNSSLDQLIKKFGLDSTNPMTWMCIGYTIRANGLDPVLANQALDNALALKYFD